MPIGRYTLNDPSSASTQAFDLLNQNISRVGDFMLQRKLGEIKRKQEFQDAIALEKEKAKIAQEYDPESQFRQQVLGLITGGGTTQPSTTINTSMATTPSLGGGFKPKGLTYGGFTFEREPTQEEKQADIQTEAMKQAATASEKEKQVNATKVSRLNNIVNEIEKQYALTKTPGGNMGAIRRPLETFSRGLQLTENQRQDKAYADFVGGIRAQLARAMGDVGNLSEYEQKAVMNLVPTLLDDPRTAAMKIQNIRSFIAQIQIAASPNQTVFGSGQQQSAQPAFGVQQGQERTYTPEEARQELRRRGVPGY